MRKLKNSFNSASLNIVEDTDISVISVQFFSFIL